MNLAWNSEQLTPAYETNLGILVISFGPSEYTLAPMKIIFETCETKLILAY
jgi:hypothetical protein